MYLNECVKKYNYLVCFYQGLAVFFGKSEGLRREVVRDVLNQIHDIQAWMKSQTDWAFYASSLLLVYEGDRNIHSDTEPPQKTRKTEDKAASIDTNDESNTGDVNGLSDNSAAAQKTCTSATKSKSEIKGDTSETQGTKAVNLPPPPSSNNKPLSDVRMIDFAHVFPSNKTDDNYLDALNSVVKYLTQLLETD